MARVAINTGATANDGTGDSLRSAGGIINSNFLDIYTYFGDGTNLSFSGGKWETTSSGINTLSNVGIGTTNPRFDLEVGAVGTSGTSLWVNGDARVTGILTVGTASITLNGSTNTINVGSGVTINGSTGAISATSIVVDGTTFTNELSVSGVSTFSGTVNVPSSLYLNAPGDASDLYIGSSNQVKLDHNGSAAFWTNTTGYSYIRGASGFIVQKEDGGFDDIIKGIADGAVELYYDNVKKFETLGAGVTITGTTFTNQLNVSGVSTFQAFNSYVEMGNPSYYAGLRLISGATEARILQSGSGDLYLTSQSNRNISLNTYAMFGDSNSLGNVQLNNGNVGDTKVGSGITFISSTRSIYVEGTTLTNQLSVSGVSTVGIVTGATYYGDASNTVDGRWTLGANGTSDYTFTGIGFTQTTNDPILYLARGRVYEFVNNSGGAHPFEIRVSNGGAAYSDGVTNNTAATGVIRFEVPMNSPNTLYYQCTNHSGMGNTISVYPNLFT